MVYSVDTEDEVRLWWDPRKEFCDGYIYRVTIDGACVYTKEVFYNFKNLRMDKPHNFTVELLDSLGNKVGKTETFTNRNCYPYRTPLNVTKEPYNAIGDGKTDCTKAIQKAYDDCTINQYVYFPLGCYKCGKIIMNGDIKTLFDAGACICTNGEEDVLC